MVPMCIELGSSIDWSFCVQSSPLPEERVAAVILLLLKFIYPIAPPKHLDEMVRAPEMELTEEEASILFYIRNLPSYEKWMSGVDRFFQTEIPEPEKCFRRYFESADHELRAASYARKGI